MSTVHKQKVTLSLDGATYQKVRALLSRIPGKPSVSALVDDLFGQFVGAVGPVLDEVEADPASQARALLAFHGNIVRESSVELDQLLRELDTQGKEERQDLDRRIQNEALAYDVKRPKTRTRKAKVEGKE